MRILLVHKYYYRRGGDCVYVLNLEEGLKKMGHEVAIFSMSHPSNFETPWSSYFPSEVDFSKKQNIFTALRRPFGTGEVASKFSAMIDEFRPDVVHFNNIHSQLSPIVVEIAKRKGIRVVWTIHDYKLLCPRYDCLKSGVEPCELCFDDKSFVLKKKCMKNSLIASILAYGEAKKWSRERLEKSTDVFVAPSEFMRSKLIKGGFSPNKVVTLLNSINTDLCKNVSFEKSDYYCFIGRLSHEKGINTLLEAASKLPYKLILIGTGPLYSDLKKHESENIEFVGFKNWEEIKAIVSKARFSVVPSEWYETFGLVNAESMCLGTPVLGANVGGIPELIIDGDNGMIFESRNVDDLKNKIELMWNADFNYQKISNDALIRFDSDSYCNEILKIYQGDRI